MEIRRRLRVIILTLLWVFQGDTEKLEIPKREMEVVKGQSVVLQAWYSPRTDIAKNSVMWNFDDEARNLQIISFSSGEIGGPIIPNEFTHRVNFSKDMPSANLSIYINNTQESDSGRYTCDVLYFGDSGLTSFKGNVLLNVKVPPSPPVCTMTGDPVLKGNVTLSCKSSHGKPVPQYRWTKIAPVSEVFFSPMQNERQGTLRLSNLTRSMSGKFVCRASNTAGSESCSINLEVITSSNTGMIAAATLGSIVGLVAMLLFLIFILRRNRDTEEEIANEIKEDAQAPKRVSWAKSNSGSDIISKNGTLSSIATASPQSQDPHQPNFHYQYSPVLASDMGSLINAYHLQPGETNQLQGLPGYNLSSTPSRKLKSMNGGPRHTPRRPRPHTPIRTEGAQPQVPHPLTISLPISSLSLTDMGRVTVTVPTKSEAGSLV